MIRFSSAICCLLLSVVLVGCGSDVRLPTGRRVKDDGEDLPPSPPPAPPTQVAAAPATPPPAAAPPDAAATGTPAPAAPAPTPNQTAAGPATPTGNAAANPQATPEKAPAATLPTADVPVTQAPLPPPSSVKIDTEIAPTAPDQQLLEQTVYRMRRILFALDAYSVKNGHYPPAIILNDKGEPLYSWRVELLPFLGYEELYALFDKTLPWNDPKNLPLLASIPLEFQSPHRGNDGKTTFFAAKGRGCAFQGVTPVERAQFTDGFNQTILLVEADDPMAQPWTCPRDYDYRRSSPGSRLGKMRQGGFLSGWADGEVRRVESSLPKDKLRAIFTIAGNENISLRTVSKPWEDVATRTTTQVASIDVPTGSLFPEIEGATAAFSQQDVAETFENRVPVPAVADIERARKELKAMFADELAKATNATKLGEFAKKMLTDAEKYKADPPAYYAILVAVRDTAAKQGEYPVVLEATTKLLDAFRLDSLAERRKMLESLGERIKKESLDTFRKDTEQIVEQAIAGDDYKTAAVASDSLVKATRRALAKEKEPSGSEPGKKKPKPDDPAITEIKRVTQLHDDVLERKRSFEKVAAAKETLAQTPEDPQANQDFGEYLCLHKGDWNGGLPYLAKSADIKLKFMAGIDVATPRDAQQMLDLGDLYWELGEKKDNLPKMWLLLRAIYWYRQSVAVVPPTLARARAEKRMQQANTTYGEAMIEKHLRTMAQAPSEMAKLVSTGGPTPQ